MSAIGSFVSSISGYIPAAVKDAAGLSPQISEAVRHITWLAVERVFWPPNESLRFLLVLGYSDGFQLWDLQDPTAARELVSKQDKAVNQARLLSLPLRPWGMSDREEEQPLGLAKAPLMAYLHRGSPALVRLFSFKANDDVHLLRLTEPARSLQSSRRFFAVGFTSKVDIYDALQFNVLFSVQCNPASGPTFALGPRWLAYNLPPQPVAAPAAASGLLGGASRQLPSIVKDGLQYLGQVGQRTLDHVLMPSQEGADQVPRGGVVAVRDAFSRAVIAQFEDHTEPVEAMAWDPSGLQLITCAALGHRVLVHRALLAAEHALVVHDAEKGHLELGSVVFQHLYTLSRGYTPAVISDIAVSDDGQLVAVSSAKGTTHVFRLPPLHSAALGGHHLMETGAVRLTPTQPCTSEPPGELGISLSLGGGGKTRPVNLSVCTRVRLGSVLLQEGLMPQCGFLSVSQSVLSIGRSGSRDPWPRMYVATRAGTLALYSLTPPSAPPGASSEPLEWQAVLAREFHTCRAFRHFTERRLNLRDLAPLGGQSRARASTCEEPVPGSHAFYASPRLSSQASPTLGPKDLRAPSPEAAPRVFEEPSKWLSAVEMATHVPVEVPLWLCPQLSFFAYPVAMPRGQLCTALREGQCVPGRRRLLISRPERPGDGVRYDAFASSPGAEERLSRLFGGALGASLGAPQGNSAVTEGPRRSLQASASVRAASISVGSAWGAIQEQHLTHQGDLSLEQPHGIGSALDVEEDWLRP